MNNLYGTEAILGINDKRSSIITKMLPSLSLLRALQGLRHSVPEMDKDQTYSPCLYHNSKVKKIEVIKDEGKTENLSWGRVRKRKNDERMK